MEAPYNLVDRVQGNMFNKCMMFPKSMSNCKTIVISILTGIITILGFAIIEQPSTVEHGGIISAVEGHYE